MYTKIMYRECIINTIDNTLNSIKNFQDTWWDSEGCFHVSIAQPVTVWNEWQSDYWCYFNSDTSSLIRLLFVSLCSRVCRDLFIMLLWRQHQYFVMWLVNSLSERCNFSYISKSSTLIVKCDAAASINYIMLIVYRIGTYIVSYNKSN